MVSICMPNHNRAEYLAEAIQSVLAQTHKDWELIIVDDGSTDSSRDLLRWYEKKDKRIKCVFTHNQGIAKARNCALRLARGSEIAVMDSDDIMNPKRLKLSLRALQKADFVYGPYMQADERGQVKGVYDPPTKITPENVDHVLDGNWPHVTIMARRKCFDEHPYREELRVNDDAALCLDWYKAGYKAKKINEPLMIVRYHPTSVSATRDREVKKITAQLLTELHA